MRYRIDTEAIILKVSNDLIAPYFSSTVLDKKVSLDSDKTIKENKNKLVNGNLYSLSGTECDDFKMPIKTYEMVGKIDNLNGIDLNSVIMKQVGGDKGTLFSLTKLDCSNIGIKWQPGLQLFPYNLDWKKVEQKNISTEEIREIPEGEYFIKDDLSTYPSCFIDKTIRNIIIELNWIDFYNANAEILRGSGIEPFGYVKFNELLKISFTDSFSNLLSSLYGSYNNNNMIYFKVVTNKIINSSNLSRNSNITLLGKVYIELSFKRPFSGGGDGYVGILPEFFKNKSINDVIKINCKCVKNIFSELDTVKKLLNNVDNIFNENNCPLHFGENGDVIFYDKNPNYISWSRQDRMRGYYHNN